MVNPCSGRENKGVRKMQINHTLIAINSQGARVKFHGQSISACLRAFDANYYRKGWSILVRSAYGEKIIKKTFR